MLWGGWGSWSTSSSYSSFSSSTRPAGVSRGAHRARPREQGTRVQTAQVRWQPLRSCSCLRRREPPGGWRRGESTHRPVPPARGLFTRVRESARAGASSGCGVGAGPRGRGRPIRGRDGGGADRVVWPDRAARAPLWTERRAVRGGAALQRSTGAGSENFPLAAGRRARRGLRPRGAAKGPRELRAECSALACAALAAACKAGTSDSAAPALHPGGASGSPASPRLRSVPEALSPHFAAAALTVLR